MINESCVIPKGGKDGAIQLAQIDGIPSELGSQNPHFLCQSLRDVRDVVFINGTPPLTSPCP